MNTHSKRTTMFATMLLISACFALMPPLSFAKPALPTHPETPQLTSPSEGKTPPNQVHVNSAGVTELMQLHGVGATLAKRIVAYREQHGKFSSLDDLTHIRGLSQKIVASNRELLVLN